MNKNKFVELVNHSCWKDEFIGYGNPYADILIIGQEAATVKSIIKQEAAHVKNIIGQDDALKKEIERYEKFYKPNQSQWKETIEHNHLPQTDSQGEYKFPKFVPSFPFKTQKATIRSGDGNSGATWYWYQRLHDQIYPDAKDPNGNINFFERIFITELNGEPRKNHKDKQENIKSQIAKRFDIMRETKSFWSHFKAVLFLCGSYSEAIDVDSAREILATNPGDESASKKIELFESIFGHKAIPFYGPQFSGRDRHHIHPKAWIEKYAGDVRKALLK